MRHKTPLCAVLALTLPALAVHKKNAGPEDVELKFKLPAPAPLTPEQALGSFQLEKGFKIELVASEPMIETPVAISFDDQGRLYVVEMRGYMHDISGEGEDKPTGRISLLEDTDGDGKMDKASVFLDGLVMPRSVMAVNGGALVAEPPHLYFCKDTDGDGKADKKEIVTTDYGTKGGQPEHMPNTPVWTLDNSIWSAGYGSRFKLRGGAWLKDVGLSRGQWGLCQDDAGRLYYNYNSDMLRADLLPTEAFARNPLLRNATSINSKLAADQTLYPSHPTPGVNRGYDTKSLRSDGTLTKPTATCGALIYRGDAFPTEFKGNAFVPEPSANLVKRFTMSEKGGALKATNTSKKNEFLTSIDERFRPVQAMDGPDGALYIVDMYRGIIQHESFLTHYLIANIKDRKLEQPVNQGRIWRIVHEGKLKPQATKLHTTTEERIKSLRHPSGWVRDTAQRLLVESGDAAAAPALKQLLTDGEPVARLHALWTLDGLGSASHEVLKLALTDSDARVRAATLRISPRDFIPPEMSGETDLLVLANLAIKLTTLNLPDADAQLAKLLATHGTSPLVVEAALTGLRGKEASFAKLLATTNGPGTGKALGALAQLIAQAGKADPFNEMLTLASTASTGRTDILKGLSFTESKSKTPKLLWLESEPAALKTFKRDKTLSLIEKRLAWPGKPGAPPPPKIAPLNETQLAAFERGKLTYNTLCAACHQPHGYGLDGLAPPLVDSEWVLGKPEVLARIVMHGLAGPVKVNGRNYNLAMPPLPQLTDENIADVLTFIRREWDHTGSPVSSDFVAKVRAADPSRVMMWTESELKKLATEKKKG
ncbi:MAG: c-type cytochrome [Verrucomicrobiaceae bacterium]|nr:c-type cytochrome [Verrucomicrobiaceae bacterium]